MSGQSSTKTKSNQYLQAILKSIAPLFYVSRIVGVLPFSMTDYINHKQLRSSISGTLWSVIIIIVHCTQYHIAVSNSSFGQNSQGDTNTLTTVIGVFIVYMEPLMMCVGILTAIFNQRLSIACTERLAKIDADCERLGTKAPDQSVTRLSVFLIIATIVCELGLVLFNFVQFTISDNILYQTYWWVCSGIPIFTDSISRLWYVILIYMVRMRIEIINKYCCELQKTFKEKKEKYAQMNKQPRTPTIAIGYLGQEIFDPKQLHNRKPSSGIQQRIPTTTMKSNKIHVVPGEGTKTYNFSEKDMPNIFLTEKEFAWTDDNRFVVEEKMDKKLIELTRIHDELCEIAKVINRIFSFQILLTVAYGFMSVTAQLYFLYCGLVGQTIPVLFRSAESLAISCIYIWYTSTKCVSIVQVSWRTKLEAQKTGIFLHKMANVVDENHFYSIVNHLSLKLLNNQLVLTACGFFELDMTTLYAITGAITSYLIILIQFNLAAHKTRTIANRFPMNITLANAFNVTLNGTI